MKNITVLQSNQNNPCIFFHLFIIVISIYVLTALNRRIRLNKYNCQLNRLRIQTNFEMGANCANCVGSTKKYSNQNKTLPNFYYHPNEVKGPGIVIELFGLSKVSPNEQDAKENKPMIYTTRLSSTQIMAKYIPNVGFSPYDLSTKLLNNELAFQIFKNKQLSQYQVFLKTQCEQHLLWKKIQQPDLLLQERQSIKIGNTVFIYKGILNHTDITQTEKDTKDKIILCEDTSVQCRFCLENESSEKNPMIIPCKCAGSINAVHQKCLSDWIFKDTKYFNQNMPTFQFKVRQFECEICKQSFIDYIWHRLMFVLTKFGGNYSIFETKSPKILRPSKMQQKQYLLFRFKGENSTFKIGKSPQCQYIINDPNINQINTILQIKGGKAFISDNNSKYGTYIQTQNNILRVNQQYRLDNLYFSLKSN